MEDSLKDLMENSEIDVVKEGEFVVLEIAEYVFVSMSERDVLLLGTALINASKEGYALDYGPKSTNDNHIIQ